MSAYIVENETINRVITALVNTQTTTTRYPLEKMGYDFYSPADLQRLCRDMAAMNCRSVQARYPNESVDNVEEFYRFEQEPSLNFVQPYKSLQCYLYQSCEGDCELEPLFQALDRVKHQMAAAIISKLPAYDAAQWA